MWEEGGRKGVAKTSELAKSLSHIVTHTTTTNTTIGFYPEKDGKRFVLDVSVLLGHQTFFSASALCVLSFEPET